MLLSLPWIDPSVNPAPARISCAHADTSGQRLARRGRRAAGRPERAAAARRACRSPRGGRPLKRWRWVGAFSAEAMLCAARARVGGVPVTWWAVWDGERLHERTHRARRASVRMAPGHVRAPGRIDLRFEEGEGVEVVSPHGAQYIWTRKQGGIADARARVLGAARSRAAASSTTPPATTRAAPPGAGRPASGIAESGARVAWNLVDGVHDGPQRLGAHRLGRRHAAPGRAARRSPTTSPRSATCAARPSPCARTASACSCFASDYEQPFGRFSGSLPARRERSARAGE